MPAAPAKRGEGQAPRLVLFDQIRLECVAYDLGGRHVTPPPLLLQERIQLIRHNDRDALHAGSIAAPVCAGYAVTKAGVASMMGTFIFSSTIIAGIFGPISAFQ